jgi:hypothetical protein
MLCRTVSLKRKVSCGTKPISRRSTASGSRRTSTPSSRIAPRSGS